jgi:hypothetical protein
MRKRYIGKYNSGQTVRGAVLVELILVAPLMLFMTGYILRLTQILEARLVAITISREMATQVFKNCVDITIIDVPDGTNEVPVNTTDSESAIFQCVTEVGNNFQNSWASLAPTAAVSTAEGGDGRAVSPLLWKAQALRYGFNRIGTSPCDATTPIVTIGVNSAGGEVLPDTSLTRGEQCNRNRIARAAVRFTIQPVFAFLSLSTLWGAESAAPGEGENGIVIQEVSEI